MKRLQILILIIAVIASASALFGCGGALPTAVPPTAAPTQPPATVAPTAIPPTPMPSATNTPAVASVPGGDDAAVATAFRKFTAAPAFRLNARAEVSPFFFQGNLTPAPGDDPDKVTIFTIQGEQKDSNLQYALGGFMASFIGAVTGFDPDRSALDLAIVDGTFYAQGVLPGESAAKWFVLPADQTASTRFAPKDLLAPITEAAYADGAFAQAGTDTVDGQPCTMYTGSRAAFVQVLPRIIQAALLDTETLEPANVDAFEFKMWVCGDGNLHRVLYKFDARAKNDADKKGSFALDAQLGDYAGDIVIRAPADAVPFPKSAANNAPTSEPTATRSAQAKPFTSLDGEWQGTSSTDSPIQFSVENGQITYANLNYSINTGSCSGGGAFGTSVDDGAITDQQFSIVLTNSDDVRFGFAGKFESKDDAAGTLTIKGKTFCGDTDDQVTWTAKHVSAPESEIVEPPDEPTEQAMPTEPAGGGDNARMIRDVFAALNTKDVNVALAGIDDDVVYNIAGTAGVGKTSLQSYVQLALAAGATFAVSNVQDLGGIVTFTVQVSGPTAGTFNNSSAIVEDGKISVLTIQ